MLSTAHIFWTCAAFAFVFGALIGSFLNVVIYRVPAGLSIVSPGSACPSCSTPVKWYDNIPIVSWFVLRGKCRTCKAPFSIRYAGVELLTALLAGVAWWQAAGWMLGTASAEAVPLPEPHVLGVVAVLFLLRFTLFAFLIVIAFIDLDHFIIPHAISLPGIALGLASPWIVQWMVGPVYALGVMWPPVSPMTSIVGAILGFLMIIALFYAYFAVRGVEGLGGGDATLMALIGAWLGWPALVFVLFAASFQGVLAAGVSMLLGGSFVRNADEIFTDEEEEAADADEGAASVEDGVEDGVEASIEDGEDGSNPHEGKLAVPFGPFLTLAALEFAILGPYLPDSFNMIYLY